MIWGSLLRDADEGAPTPDELNQIHLLTSPQGDVYAELGVRTDDSEQGFYSQSNGV